MVAIDNVRPMLGEKAVISKLVFPLYASVKIDGMRCLIRDARAKSRSFLDIANQHVQALLGNAMFEGLDGEICVGQPNDIHLMQQTSSGCNSRAGRPDFVYWVFDYWSGNACSTPYEKRYSILVDWFVAGNAPGYMRLLEQKVIHSQEELDEFEAWAIEQGYEGVMVRKIDGFYKYGRSTAREGLLLKLKRFIDGEARIVGFEELMHNENELTTDELGLAKRSSHKDGKVAGGMLGKLIVEECETGVLFKIGTGLGLTHELRKEIWNNQARYLGQIVNYRSQHVGVKDRPRIPVMHGFRSVIDMGVPNA